MRKATLLLVALIFIQLNSNAQTYPVYNRSFISCMGVELDGSQTLRVLGYGRNKRDAKEQAMKNAVWAVIFDGIREGTPGCDMRPLVSEVNARERYEDYFNKFFADGGDYKKFVSLRDTRKNFAKKAKDRIGYSYETTVRVLCPKLKSHLKKDNIIDNSK